MNAIIGFSDLLDQQLHETVTSRQQRYFANIRDAGQHLLRLINDVLDLAKVEAGGIELHRKPIDVEQLLEPVVASARRDAAERGIGFATSMTENAIVNVDGARIRQVLYNLTSNALKFTPSGGDVALRARVEGRDLLLKVSDTGIGIPEDRQDRLFDAFVRVNEDRSTAPGTGLGLALSLQLVEQHGGAITFASVEDAGTTFSVRLRDVVVADQQVGVVEEEQRETVAR
jgi:signal transduction histidine kinase